MSAVAERYQRPSYLDGSFVGRAESHVCGLLVSDRRTMTDAAFARVDRRVRACVAWLELEDVSYQGELSEAALALIRRRKGLADRHFVELASRVRSCLDWLGSEEGAEAESFPMVRRRYFVVPNEGGPHVS